MNKSIVILCLPILLFAGNDERRSTSSGSDNLTNALVQIQDDYPYTPPNSTQNSPNNSPPHSPANVHVGNSIELSVPAQLTMQYPVGNQMEQDSDQELVELQEDNSSDPFWNAVCTCAVFVSMYFYFSH